MLECTNNRTRVFAGSGRIIRRVFGSPWRLGLLALILIVLLAYGFRRPLLGIIGKMTMVEDTIERCDLMMVLNGAFPRSVLAATELHRRFPDAHVLTTRERLWDNIEDAREMGFQIQDVNDMTRSLLTQSSIPADQIHHSSETIESTRDEAFLLKRFLAAHPDHHYVTVLTRRAHSRRARWIFQKINPQAHISVKTYSKDPIQSDNWWQDTWHIFEVSMECLKYVYQWSQELLPIPKK